MADIEVLSPVAQVHADDLPLAPRDGSLHGKTIDFLSNRKANASFLLEHVEFLLRERYGDFPTRKGEKNASLGAPGMLDPRSVSQIQLLRCRE